MFWNLIVTQYERYKLHHLFLFIFLLVFSEFQILFLHNFKISLNWKQLSWSCSRMLSGIGGGYIFHVLEGEAEILTNQEKYVTAVQARRKMLQSIHVSERVCETRRALSQSHTLSRFLSQVLYNEGRAAPRLPPDAKLVEAVNEYNQAVSERGERALETSRVRSLGFPCSLALSHTLLS